MTDDTRRTLHRNALDPTEGVLDEAPAGGFRLPRWTVVYHSGAVPMRDGRLCYVVDINDAHHAIRNHRHVATIVWILRRGKA